MQVFVKVFKAIIDVIHCMRLPVAIKFSMWPSVEIVCSPPASV